MAIQAIPRIRKLKNSLPKLSANERGLFEASIEKGSGIQESAERHVDGLAYYTAFVLIQEVDYHLERGEHYRVDGCFCRTLDETVRALRAVKAGPVYQGSTP